MPQNGKYTSFLRFSREIISIPRGFKQTCRRCLFTVRCCRRIMDNWSNPVYIYLRHPLTRLRLFINVSQTGSLCSTARSVLERGDRNETVSVLYSVLFRSPALQVFQVENVKENILKFQKHESVLELMRSRCQLRESWNAIQSTFENNVKQAGLRRKYYHCRPLL